MSQQRQHNHHHFHKSRYVTLKEASVCGVCVDFGLAQWIYWTILMEMGGLGTGNRYIEEKKPNFCCFSLCLFYCHISLVPSSVVWRFRTCWPFHVSELVNKYWVMTISWHFFGVVTFFSHLVNRKTGKIFFICFWCFQLSIIHMKIAIKFDKLREDTSEAPWMKPHSAIQSKLGWCFVECKQHICVDPTPKIAHTQTKWIMNGIQCKILYTLSVPLHQPQFTAVQMH